MAYAQDTITSANAANDFVTVLDGLLTTAGWSTVETLTPSGNFRNRVYKSSGLSNLCGYDWYLAVMWTTIGTENYVRVFGFESYNAGTHIASGISGAASTGSTSGYASGQPATGFLSATTINLSSVSVSTAVFNIAYFNGGTGSSVNQLVGFQTLIPSSAFGYWMSVTLDHVALWTTVATNTNDAVISTLILDEDYVSAGLYGVHPIVTFNRLGLCLSSAIIGPTITSTVWTAVAFNVSGTFGAKLPALTDTYFPAYAWAPILYLTFMAQGSANPTPTTSMLGQVVVGHVPDFLAVWGGSIGDTVEVDSATYVLTSSPITISGSSFTGTPALLVE